MYDGQNAAGQARYVIIYIFTMFGQSLQMLIVSGEMNHSFSAREKRAQRARGYHSIFIRKTLATNTEQVVCVWSLRNAHVYDLS